MEAANSIRESTKTADISVSAVQIPDECTTADESVAETPNTPRRDFESSALYVGVYDYVKQYMSRYDPSHDFNHVLRVLALAKHILAEELAANPQTKYQRQAVILAALLHDVGDRKYIFPGENAERLIEKVLADNGCPPRFIAKVALIVEHVSYSSEVKRPQLVNAMVAAHPELGIVQDADRLDSIGAIGVGRVFAYGAAKCPERGLEGSIDHFVEKLEKVESMMKTHTGMQMARERTQRLQEFRRWWEEEQRLES
ncbi:hypothetical protein LTR35_012364 [Friedmanniomyces endolithicus]|uniref:HD/PDEase domain-containing protein n=1 Tax=Friedmanniomyces endolithicus TaxID=329885 RepID=A0AAN6J4B6_9PEZI|nr:hypothetical protein LTR35_012364 [Friedmanniomyces endolithicus]KAK0281388.1 hypothetical protein LTS00_012597 [Friedmanniomyces endolithicus]KAK0313399.1 hypothetical protein LTR82_013430 [Friedmanniomyces endolithicus]KAK1015246.1 hypothetical protein LTR54_003789 [Friedmanniomyces endolithicus]